MTEISIQIKLKETGLLTPAPERAAYRMFIDGVADISANASILGAKDESEESDVRMTIRALIEQKMRTPHGKAFIHGEEFDQGSQRLFEILRDEFFTNHQRSYQDEICKWVQANHLELNYSDETIKRKLRHIRKFGRLETDGNGFYALKTEQRLKREIMA